MCRQSWPWPPFRTVRNGYNVCDSPFDVEYPDAERRKEQTNQDLEPVVLKKKLADALNGIVLAGFKVGDRICIARHQAALLIAEGWACPVPPGQRRRTV